MQYSATDKGRLRKEFTQRRKAAFTEEKCRKIAEQFLKLPLAESADTVLLYAAFGSEVQTDSIAASLLEAGKNIAYPRCGDGGAMTFHIITDTGQLEISQAGKFSIREPELSLPQPVITGDTLCVLPGLAFTENGGRLGYGGGFYDRFIAAHPEMCLAALAFEAQITSGLPLMPHDIYTDMIITEERTVICNER